MNICVLAETKEPDISVYTEIIRKILNALEFENKYINFVDVELNIRSKGQLITQLSANINLLVSKNNIDFFIVIVDCDKSDENNLYKLISQEVEKIKEFPKERIIVGIAKRNIEAWLLCDEKNLMNITGVPNLVVYKKAESISDPKGILRGIWRQSPYEIQYTNLLSLLSKSINIQLISKKSKNFKSLYEIIQSKTKQI